MAVVDMGLIEVLVLVLQWMMMVSAGTALALNAKSLSLTQYLASKLLRMLSRLERVIKSSHLVGKPQL